MSTKRINDWNADSIAHRIAKTVTQACKAWPAAANIINGQMGVEAVKQMDVPLEQLLGKFLLALPAPEVS